MQLIVAGLNDPVTIRIDRHLFTGTVALVIGAQFKRKQLAIVPDKHLRIHRARSVVKAPQRDFGCDQRQNERDRNRE